MHELIESEVDMTLGRSKLKGVHRPEQTKDAKKRQKKNIDDAGKAIRKQFDSILKGPNAALYGLKPDRGKRFDTLNVLDKEY